MLVRFVTLARGPDLVANPGDEREVSDEVGAQLVAGGYATEIGVPPVVESAVAPAGETATQERPRRRRAAGE